MGKKILTSTCTSVGRFVSHSWAFCLANSVPGCILLSSEINAGWLLRRLPRRVRASCLQHGVFKRPSAPLPRPADHRPGNDCVHGVPDHCGWLRVCRSRLRGTGWTTDARASCSHSPPHRFTSSRLTLCRAEWPGARFSADSLRLLSRYTISILSGRQSANILWDHRCCGSYDLVWLVGSAVVLDPCVPVA